jgi:hypothetical protein
MGLSFAIAAGPRHRSHPQVRVPRDSWPHFTVSDSRLPNLEARFPYLYSPRTGWPSYTLRHWVLFSSPSTTRRTTVEVFHPASTRLTELTLFVPCLHLCTDHIEDTVLLLYVLRALPSNGRCLQSHRLAMLHNINLCGLTDVASGNDNYFKGKCLGSFLEYWFPSWPNKASQFTVLIFMCYGTGEHR